MKTICIIVQTDPCYDEILKIENVLEHDIYYSTLQIHEIEEEYNRKTDVLLDNEERVTLSFIEYMIKEKGFTLRNDVHVIERFD